MTGARSSSRVSKVDAGSSVEKKDVVGRVVEPLAPVTASSSGIEMLAQAKLSVGRVDDPAELEADEMAQKFSQWSDQGVGGVDVSEGSSSGDAMRSAETGTLQTGGFEVGADVQSEISSRSGRGEPLADGQRAKFEQFFGKDLSAVRVHADSDAARLSGSLGADAFTVGSDVYFGAGRYQSGASDKLLAHELTHVVQQNSTINRWPKWLDKLRGKNQAPAVPPRNRTSSPLGDTGVKHNPLFEGSSTDEAGYEIPRGYGAPEEPTHQTLDEVRAQMASSKTSEPIYSQPVKKRDRSAQWSGDDLTGSSAIMSQGDQTFDIPYEGLHHKGDDLTGSSAIMSQGDQTFDIPYDKSNWTPGTDKKEKDHAEKKKKKKNHKAEKSFIKTQGTLLKHLPNVPENERLILAKISPDSVTTRYGKPGQGLTKTEYDVFGKYSYEPLVKKSMGIKNDLYQLQQIALGGDKTKMWNSLTLTERMVASYYAFEIKAKGNHDFDEPWSQHNAAFLEGASMNGQDPSAKKSAIEKRTKKAWAETLSEPTPEERSELNKKEQEKIPLQQDILKKIMKILEDETYVDGKKYEGEVETLLSHGGRVNMIIPKLAGKDAKKDEFMIKLGLFDEKGGKNSAAGVEKRGGSSHDIAKNPDGTFSETKVKGKAALSPKLGQKLGMNIAAGGAGKKDINGDVIRPDGSHGHLYMHWVPPTEESDGVFQVGLETTAFSFFRGIKGTTGRSHGLSDNEDTATPISSMDGAKNDRGIMGLGGSVGSVYKRLPDDWAETLLKATNETRENLEAIA